MPKKRKSDTKDPATKNTFNPPGGKRDSKVKGPQTLERQVGQFTGEGAPALQKK
jgi:hypothetical protein